MPLIGPRPPAPPLATRGRTRDMSVPTTVRWARQRACRRTDRIGYVSVSPCVRVFVCACEWAAYGHSLARRPDLFCSANSPVTAREPFSATCRAVDLLADARVRAPRAGHRHPPTRVLRRARAHPRQRAPKVATRAVPPVGRPQLRGAHARATASSRQRRSADTTETRGRATPRLRMRQRYRTARERS